MTPSAIRWVALTPVFDSSDYYYTAFSVDRDAKRLICTRESGTKPKEIVLINLSDGSIRKASRRKSRIRKNLPAPA